MPTRETVLVTGAAGRVAGLIAPTLRAEFRLRLLDRVALGGVADDEVVRADVRDVRALETACSGVTALVHLAGQPAEASFRDVLLPENLDGTWAAYEAAVRSEVPRFVFASTLQTVEGNPPGTLVAVDLPPRPTSVYGCTKLFGEALGRYHADGSALGVACLRIGAVRRADDPSLASEETKAIWCGSIDLARLIVAAIRSHAPFATVIAVSPPATRRFETANPFGWEPREEPAG